MSFFTVLFVIFIVISVVRSLLKHLNEQKPQQTSRFNWENYHSSRLRSILSTYNNFQDEEIIDSAVGFYLFSYNDETGEFIFIQEDGIKVIHHIKYQQLTSYNIRYTRDYNIFIDFKTSVPNKSYVSIECFNREIVLKKVPYLSSNLTEMENLYRLEKEKVDEIGSIFEQILDEYKDTETPPVYQEVVKEIPLPIVPLPQEEETEIIEVNEEIRSVETEEYTPDYEELIPETAEVPIEDIPDEILPDTPTVEEQENFIQEEETTVFIPEISNDKIQVSLSDIDEYSRGKFLDWEVQSAVGDAKVKGQKFIYLSAEQLEKLKS
ncbi:hypothetical protein D0T84_03090 [Dysgonomonas sp. 521]|uniref:hypothetical protein n=1 Tax=Dysgonomonas sp. 521 TaxID=2302932 RepID=UPI0013D1E806|nr:hypothetical protein [Dysgonomonas sp. 521]NDV93904.1 hypothetical protein [Dysgonomonas sp. 521]